ncbi:hypothetical protein TELCIR_17764 [Teladorsagia circumcincta]|uniref:Uncharacterized protein n=1 Tax=Teladorsagia circumcincta TaxID=45464 RepID=A0A2G9TTD3_TELCI|nr:hypothetical protein TELCIR_17764 [Teladorsagia circumcincta]
MEETIDHKEYFIVCSCCVVFNEFYEDYRAREETTMAIDLKQQLDVIDYFGALVVWVVFFSFMFIVSVTCINWCCIQKHDDITVLEEVMGGRQRNNDSFQWGYHHHVNMRLGPHRPSMIARSVRQSKMEPENH